MPNIQVEKRRAIEALRAGVPNRDVVRELPPIQDELKEQFASLLSSVSDGSVSGTCHAGLLLEGDFGTGKSHWLEYFRYLALEDNFVVSSITLNKETPLYDLKKVYRACVESAIVKGKVGPALTEIALTYHSDRAPYYSELFAWVNSTPDIDPRFSATLQLFIKTTDEEVRQQIVNDWTGYPMKVTDIRDDLRAVGETGVRVGAAKKGPDIQRFEYLSRFFHSAGYKGWLILLDEGEIMGNYSLQQRASAYANLAQLFGHESALDGLATVLTISSDYIGTVIIKRNDREKIPAKLGGTRNAGKIPLAEKGMDLIQRKAHSILAYSSEQVDDVYHRVRKLYSLAYNWDAPDLENRPEVLLSRRMRQYIRYWINAWDFRRLYDTAADIVTEDVLFSYDEDTDMQLSSDEDDADIKMNIEDDEPTITL